MPVQFIENADNTQGFASGAGLSEIWSDRNLLTYTGMAAGVVTASGCVAVAALAVPAQLIGGVATTAACVGGGIYLEKRAKEEADNTVTEAKPEVEVVTATA